MRTKLLIIMSLTISLSSGSFFLPDYLTKKINNKNFTEEELDLALSLKLDVAYLEQLKRAGKGSFIWLKYAQEFAQKDGETSVVLADYYLEHKAIHKSKYWYLHAIKLNYHRARLPLAKLYFDQNQLALAKTVLIRDKSIPDDFLLFAMEVAIAQGDLSFIEKHKAKLNHTDSGNLLLAKLFAYKITVDEQQNSIVPNTTSSKETCQNNLQLFATTLADLERIDLLKKQFKQSPLKQFICIELPRYIPMNKLSCSHDKSSAIQCAEDVWSSIANDVDSRYLGLLYPYGGANVHLGILYFDREDTVDILSHEILHLFGFIDEYPLPKGHAVCRGSQQEMFSHNIAVLKKSYTGNKSEVRTKVLKKIPWAKNIKSSTPILSKFSLVSNQAQANISQTDIWQLGTPELFEHEIGLFNADSCEGPSFRAFKPLSKRTHLLYYEIPLPREYLIFLIQKSEQFLMPSFHYNIAMALFRQGDIIEGKKWLLKAVDFEHKESRKLKVLHAEF